MEHFKGASLWQAPALPAHIRLSWRGLPLTNTLAYYENPLITAVKSFIVQAPELCFFQVQALKIDCFHFRQVTLVSHFSFCQKTELVFC